MIALVATSAVLVELSVSAAATSRVHSSGSRLELRTCESYRAARGAVDQLKESVDLRRAADQAVAAAATDPSWGPVACAVASVAGLPDASLSNRQIARANAAAKVIDMACSAVGVRVASSLAKATTTPDPLNSSTATAWQYFSANTSLTPVQIAGLEGNLLEESGGALNPAQVQFGCKLPPGPCGVGIAQWTDPGNRYGGLVALANANHVAWSTLGVQLQYVWQELTSTPGYGLTSLRECTNTDCATLVVETEYERPSNQSTDCSDPNASYCRRLANANEILAAYSSTPPPPPAYVAAINGCGALVERSVGSAWTQTLGCGDAKAVSVSNGYVAAINGCGALVERSVGSAWTQTLGCGDAKAVSVSNGYVAAINGCGALVERSVGSAWSPKLGCGDAKAVSVSNGYVAAINGCGALVERSVGSAWSPKLGCGDAKAVSVSNGYVAAINGCGALVERSVGSAWSPKLGCGDAKAVSVSNGYVAAINGCGALVERSVGSAWSPKLGCGDAKAVSVSNGYVAAINGCGALVERSVGSVWSPKLGCGDAKAVSLDGSTASEVLPSVPGAPTEVHAHMSSASVSVSWTAPPSNGSHILGYSLVASLGGKSVTVPTTHATLSALSPGTYTFKVRARNAVGSGPWSSRSNAVTIRAAIGGQGRKGEDAGYWMLSSDGKVYAFGTAGRFGSTSGPAVAIASRFDGEGYWVTDAAGDVSHFGTAAADGGNPALNTGERVTTISATPSGNGYWLFTNRGRALPYGDAHFYGDMAATVLNGPIVASVATPTGRGYYMVGSDGGVFSFGDAHFHGSAGAMHLNRPVVGISPTSNNEGYWLVASDGGVFAFRAQFHGSMGATVLNRPVDGLVAYGNGYLMVASDGGVFDFSDKAFVGSLGNNPPSAPIIGIAAG